MCTLVALGRPVEKDNWKVKAYMKKYCGHLNTMKCMALTLAASTPKSGAIY